MSKADVLERRLRNVLDASDLPSSHKRGVLNTIEQSMRRREREQEIAARATKKVPRSTL